MIPAYRVEGSPRAPSLLLANSLGTTSAMWDAQMPALVDRFRVIRYEHRGHGGSPIGPDKPLTVASLGGDVLDLLDHVGIERTSICGLSLGGMVGMWVAAHHPERVDGLVLACTSAYLGPPDSWAERAATVRAEGTGVLLDTLLGRWFSPGWAGDHPDVVALVGRMLAAADPEGYARGCEAIASMDQRAELGSVGAPTLVIAGAADPVTPPVTGLELQAAIPGAALAVLASAAHLANIEQPGAFTAAVVDHLTGLPLVRGERIRREVLGDAHVDRSAARAAAWSASFTDFITRYAWGDVWGRPGLDRRTRSCLTLGLLAGLGRLDEVGLHVRGARRNGLSDAEIAEILLHTAVYAGVPAANAAFAVAARVLDEMDAEDGGA